MKTFRILRDLSLLFTGIIVAFIVVKGLQQNALNKGSAFLVLSARETTSFTVTEDGKYNLLLSGMVTKDGNHYDCDLVLDTPDQHTNFYCFSANFIQTHMNFEIEVRDTTRAYFFDEVEEKVVFDKILLVAEMQLSEGTYIVSVPNGVATENVMTFQNSKLLDNSIQISIAIYLALTLFGSFIVFAITYRYLKKNNSNTSNRYIEKNDVQLEEWT